MMTNSLRWIKSKLPQPRQGVLFLLAVAIGVMGAARAASHPSSFSVTTLLIGGACGLLTVIVFAIGGWLRQYIQQIELKVETSPHSLAHRQGLRFLLWFISHNLFWLAGASLSTALLLLFFGPRLWVLVYSGGALACAGYALLGMILAKRPPMLGLCWPSPIPEGVSGYFARASATMILRERYEYSVVYDLQQKMPKLRYLNAILDLARVGGTERMIDLWESFRATLKKEVVYRLQTLAVLFLVAAILTLLMLLFNLISPNQTQSPDVAQRDSPSQTNTGQGQSDRGQAEQGQDNTGNSQNSGQSLDRGPQDPSDQNPESLTAPESTQSQQSQERQNETEAQSSSTANPPIARQDNSEASATDQTSSDQNSDSLGEQSSDAGASQSDTSSEPEANEQAANDSETNEQASDASSGPNMPSLGNRGLGDQGEQRNQGASGQETGQNKNRGIDNTQQGDGDGGSPNQAQSGVSQQGDQGQNTSQDQDQGASDNQQGSGGQGTNDQGQPNNGQSDLGGQNDNQDQSTSNQSSSGQNNPGGSSGGNSDAPEQTDQAPSSDTPSQSWGNSDPDRKPPPVPFDLPDANDPGDVIELEPASFEPVSEENEINDESRGDAAQGGDTLEVADDIESKANTSGTQSPVQYLPNWIFTIFQ